MKQTQNKFREHKMTREHSNELWNRIDRLFKAVKEKKFGSGAINDSSATERLTRRYEGLINAVDKMQDSIDRDAHELEYQRKRVEYSGGQLEEQLRQAKITMIQDRIKSKQEKLNEMLVTKADVEAKITNLKEREAKKAPAEVKVVVKEEAKAGVPKEAPKQVAEMPTTPPKATSPTAPPLENGKIDSDISDIAANANAVVEAVEEITA